MRKPKYYHFIKGETRGYGMIPPEDEHALDPKKMAIVVIDAHRGHLDVDATIPVPRGVPVIPILADFLEKVRKYRIPIIHVRSHYRKDGADRRIWPPHNVMSGLRKINPRIWEHNVEGSKYTESMVPIREEDYLVNSKRRYSAFYATDLELLLRNLESDTVILTGFATDNCVLNSGFDAVNRDFRVIVVRDCCGAISEDLEEAALKILNTRIGWVVTSKEMLNFLESKARLQLVTGP